MSSSTTSTTTAKEYFSGYLADDTIRPLNHELIAEVLYTEHSGSLLYYPTSVFEFGCGQGKNLELIRVHRPAGGVKVSGIDLSKRAVDEAHSKQRYYVDLGDEHTLETMRTNSCSVAFTCSVLDHIDSEKVAQRIVKNLKRIARDAVVLLETDRHSPGTYYYYHDYKRMGFTDLKWQYYSSPSLEGGDGSIYYMYRWEKKKNKKKNNRKKKKKHNDSL